MRKFIVALMLLVAAPSFAQSPVGFNLAPIRYYSPTPVFTDLMKTNGGWLWFAGNDWGGAEQAATLDNNGYPTEIPQIINGQSMAVRGLFNAAVDGDYVLIHDGSGTVSARNMGGGDIATSTAANKIYITLSDSALNNTRYAYVRIDNSSASDPIRNIRIIPVAYEANESAMPTFMSKFTQGLAPFSAVRFMDWARTNSSSNTHWSDRVTGSSVGQGSDKGVAWEYAIELCNDLDQDIWINVPHRVSDDYITQLATLLKNQLEPERTIYIEYSNEVWNSIFEVTNWLKNNANDHVNSYVISDLRALNNTHGSSTAPGCEVSSPPYGSTGCDWVIEKFAYMMARTFRLFGTVFGDQMDSRVVRVVGTKLNSTWHSDKLLNHLFNDDGIGADALSPTAYFGLSNDGRTALDTQEAATPGSVTVQDVIDAAWDHIPTENGYTDAQKTIADNYGVYMLAYEAGQHMDWRGDNTDSDGDGDKNNDPEDGWAQELYDAQIHHEMYDLYINRLQNQETNGVRLFMAFDYVSERESVHGSWGHLESLDQLDLSPSELATAAPKYQALLDFNGGTSTPPDPPDPGEQIDGGTNFIGSSGQTMFIGSTGQVIFAE